jgi:uncharacterized protein YjiS (DUF1127 family)
LIHTAGGASARSPLNTLAPRGARAARARADFTRLTDRILRDIGQARIHATRH